MHGDDAAPVPQPAPVEVQGRGDCVEARPPAGPAVRVHPVGGVIRAVAGTREWIDRAEAAPRAGEQVALVEVAVNDHGCGHLLAEAVDRGPRPCEAGFRRPSVPSRAVETAPHRVDQGSQSDDVPELELLQEQCNVLGIGVNRRCTRNDPLEQDRAVCPVGLQQLGCRPARPGAQAGDLVGGAIPRPGELQHRVRAVGAPDGTNRREEPSWEHPAEHELPAVGHLCLEGRQRVEPRPGLVADEAGDG